MRYFNAQSSSRPTLSPEYYLLTKFRLGQALREFVCEALGCDDVCVTPPALPVVEDMLIVSHSHGYV